MATGVDVQLEKYRLDVELSQNEWFSLYRGYRRTDHWPVIIKVLAPVLANDLFFSQRFRYMAKQAAHLEHPNIIPTYEAEEENGWLYAAQDLVEARPLAEVIEREGPFSAQRTHFIAGQIASALDYAHQKSVTHGGLSAHQVYLGAGDYIFIANFGQSQAFGSTLAQQPYTISSPETLAPERIHGQGPSRPADLYALGILCYQMLAKRAPFTGPASSVLHAQAYRQPRPLHEVNSAIPLAMSEVVGRMLAKGVELRYNTGAEFARALGVAIQNPKTSRSYAHLRPLTEQERSKPIRFKTLFYFI
jgi:serine/threonine-protein kinase